MFDFTRVHSMAQRYEAGKEFKELLIGNYDLFAREKAEPAQMKFEIQEVFILSSEQFILVSAPLEMFLEAGISTESIIQVSSCAGKIIFDTPDITSDYVCDRDCESCPLNAMLCEFDCENCQDKTVQAMTDDRAMLLELQLSESLDRLPRREIRTSPPGIRSADTPL